MFTSVYLCSLLFTLVYSFLPFFTHVYHCLPTFTLFTHFYPCLSLFTHIHSCLSLFAHSNPYLPLFTHVHHSLPWVYPSAYSSCFIYLCTLSYETWFTMFTLFIRLTPTVYQKDGYHILLYTVYHNIDTHSRLQQSSRCMYKSYPIS